MTEITWTLRTFQISELTDYAKNPRMLSKEQFAHLKKSMDKFGLIDKPIINADAAHTVIGGHQRLHVLRSEGVRAVECWYPSRELDEREVEELNIRLNKNTGSWEMDILANQWDVGNLLEWGFTKNELQFFGNEPEKTQPDEIKEQFMILIECENEQTQVELLDRFSGEGLKCRALIS